MTFELEGNWKQGLACDLHTLDSIYLGEDDYGRKHWDTRRSEMGQLVYDLKYRNDKSVIAKIIDLIHQEIKGLEIFDIIVPIPSTKMRLFQPVEEIAKALGAYYKIEVINALTKDAGGAELKNVDDLEERKNLLEKSMKLAKKYDFSDKEVLLLDDLFRSGATLMSATKILYEQANAKTVCVLTMTKTRSKQ
jgi:predicted amidophosphoribosyltransferase